MDNKIRKLLEEEEILREESIKLIHLLEENRIRAENRAHDVYMRYIVILYKLKLEGKEKEYRNVIFNFLELCSYFRLHRRGYGWKGFKIFWQDDKKKAIDCLLYSFINVGDGIRS